MNQPLPYGDFKGLSGKEIETFKLIRLIIKLDVF